MLKKRNDWRDEAMLPRTLSDWLRVPRVTFTMLPLVKAGTGILVARAVKVGTARVGGAESHAVSPRPTSIANIKRISTLLRAVLVVCNNSPRLNANIGCVSVSFSLQFSLPDTTVGA